MGLGIVLLRKKPFDKRGKEYYNEGTN